MTIPFELNTLALIGLTIAFAFSVGKLLSRVGIPQVVGFLIAGMLFGPSFLHIIPDALNDNLGFISEIALGLIGFEMGGKLRFAQLRKMGRSILWITLLEAAGAFLFVGTVVYIVTGANYIALILAAIAVSTAPAATMEVLNEYDAKGPLTTTLLAVIGLDDAVSLLLFSFAAAVAELLIVGNGGLSLLAVLQLPLIEIGGSILVGGIIGYGMGEVLKRLPLRHDAIALPIGIGLLAAGLATGLHLSLILTTMVMGVVVINRDPQHGRYIRYILEQVGPVVYILFFALAGARLHVDALATMGLLGVVYVIGRISGKYLGAWTGARIGGAGPTVRNNIGLGLLAQAGVAIGLSLEAGSRFSALGPDGQALAALVLNVVTATVFVAEIGGPIMVKLAVFRAGEAGKATNEETVVEEALEGLPTR